MVVMFTMWCCVTASKAAKKAARVENTEVSASHYICAWATHCIGVLWSSSLALFFNWLTGFRVSLSLHQYSLWTRPIHSLRQHYISLFLTHTEGKSDRCTSARTASQPNVNLARVPKKSHQAQNQQHLRKRKENTWEERKHGELSEAFQEISRVLLKRSPTWTEHSNRSPWWTSGSVYLSERCPDNAPHILSPLGDRRVVLFQVGRERQQ